MNTSTKYIAAQNHITLANQRHIQEKVRLRHIIPYTNPYVAVCSRRERKKNKKQKQKQMVRGTRVLYLFVIWPLDHIGLRKWRIFVWNSCLLSSFCFHKEVDASDCLKFDILRWVNNLLVQKPWLRGSVQNLYVLCHWCTMQFSMKDTISQIVQRIYDRILIDNIQGRGLEKRQNLLQDSNP